MQTEIDYQAPALAWYDLMGAGDWAQLRRLVSADADISVARGFPNGGHFIGSDGLFDDYFPAAGLAWDSVKPLIDQVIPAGTYTVVLGRYVGVTRETKTPFDVEFAHVWRSDGTQLTELKQYVDTALFRDRVAGIPADHQDPLNQYETKRSKI